MLFFILNSQVGGILDELPNMINKNAALLSRTERIPVVPDTVRRSL